MFNLQDNLKFPSSLEGLKATASLLTEFQIHHPHYVFVLFCSAYLYKQTFAIPGSVFMVCNVQKLEILSTILPAN